MPISTQTAVFSQKFGDHDAIKLLAKTGWDALDYSMFAMLDPNSPLNKDDYIEYAKSLKKTADEFKIIFNQSHAPFPSYIQNPDKNQQNYNEIIVFAIIRALEITSILGGETTVVHPVNLPGRGYEEQKEFNMDFFAVLLPYCKKFGVKIALENMWGWDASAKKVVPAACSTALEFNDYLNSLDENYFTACLDVGHAEMQGTGSVSACEMIRALGCRLTSLHIHDNDKTGDLHDLPFIQKSNWDEIMQALKDIGYSGELTFEADNFISKFPPELYMGASRLMLDIGRYFAAKYGL
jgi:sugar phosphate isomerase/epimerase